MLGLLRAVVVKAGAAGAAGAAGPAGPLWRGVTSPMVQQVRCAVGGFNSLPANELWKSVTLVSKHGMRRGRGKKVNSRLIKNMYAHEKRLGEGARTPMIWPGLNASSMRGRQVVEQEPAPPLQKPQVDPEAKAKTYVRRKVHPLDRGFTSVSLCGRNLRNTMSLYFRNEFDYRIIDINHVSHMTKMIGRTMTAVTIMACGNGNGLIGLGAGKNVLKNRSIQKAANKAGTRLVYIERYNDHTVLHDFFTQYYATKIFVSRKPAGYGLKCHRVIALMCRLVGIKDIEAKVEGSTMPVNIAKAFLLGLVRQKKYEEFAEEKKLHVVEVDPQRRHFPSVLASPAVCRKAEEIPTSESLDFNQHALGGRVKYVKPYREPFYTRLPSWQTHLKRAEKTRGAKMNKYELVAKYGELRSFLADKYPEARSE